MMGKRYAEPCKRWGGVWCVAVHDEYGWCYMCKYDDTKEDWVTCTFDTQEEAEKAAQEYTDFFKE
ncbi:MAG: hypothetical protein IKU35_06570 [Bacteroidaceae bacterium]|nr:hypothetical protein [Bacteroidaceae bacterium]